MFRNILSVVVGLISSFFVIEVIEIIGFKLYPPPANMNFSTPDAVKEYIASSPSIVFVLVIIGYAAGAFVGGRDGCFISCNNQENSKCYFGRRNSSGFRSFQLV